MGYGEIGLPPKKPDCYLADYDDITNYVTVFKREVATLKDEDFDKYYNPFVELNPHFLMQLTIKKEEKEEQLEIKIIRALFKSLDTCSANKEIYSKAAKTGIEAALLDIWGKILKKPLYELIGLHAGEHVSFYTAALNENIDMIIDATLFGLQFTPFLKIKLNNDLQLGQKILDRLYLLYQSHTPPLNFKWSIDANAAWTPTIAFQFLETLVPKYGNHIYMLEQPFSVDFAKRPQQEKDEWKKVKHAYADKGILVFGDESVSTAVDVEMLQEYVHGVNVKLEKAGGIRGALSVVKQAQKYNLKIWIGCMVSSRLGTMTAAHILPLSVFADLDGELLVTEDSQLFEGGYPWGKLGEKKSRLYSAQLAHSRWYWRNQKALINVY